MRSVDDRKYQILKGNTEFPINCRRRRLGRVNRSQWHRGQLLHVQQARILFARFTFNSKYTNRLTRPPFRTPIAKETEKIRKMTEYS
jgi:hypothetical protein